MSNNSEQQLQMLWPEHLLDIQPEAVLPKPVLPGDYELRTFQPDDEAGYLQVMHEAGFTSFDHEAVQRSLSKVLPDGFFVVEYRPTSQIVATAMATHNPMPLHPFGGELGWVAGSPEHAGKRLGRAVCAAATARFLRAGYRRIYLRTDDWRLPAIKTYLRLGYVPFLCAADMEARWQAVCAKLGWPCTPDEWPRHLSSGAETQGKVAGAEERPDADSPNRYSCRHKWNPHRPHRGYALVGD